MTILHLDTETFSECDLTVTGAYIYARHPTTELLMVSWAYDNGPVQLWEIGQPLPGEFLDGYYDPSVLLNAWNSSFDRNVLNVKYGVTDSHRWRDSMVKALLHGLPGKLERAGKALGLEESEAKLVDGRKLLNRFCKPAPANHTTRRYTRETHPAEWARFCEYAKQDVNAMRTIDRITPDVNYERELPLWHLDQMINDRGFLADRELAIAGASAADAEQVYLAAQMAELTGGVVKKPTQRAKLLAYLGNLGCALPDLTKSTVAEAIADVNTKSAARELLEIRQSAGKTSTAKYRALRDAICDDGRFRGGIQFAGAARTRRAAGRKFQAQNLPSRGLPPAREVELYIDALKLGIHEELFG